MRRIVLRALTAFGCFLSVVSVFLPFFSTGPVFDGNRVYVPEEMPDGVLFWSFMGAERIVGWTGQVVGVVHYGFGDYWRNVGYIGLDMSLLLRMLAAQILTVLFVVLGLVLRRFSSLWLLLTGVSSVITVSSMWSFGLAIPQGKIEVGFWLTLTSAILFFAIFAVSSIWTLRERSGVRRSLIAKERGIGRRENKHEVHLD